MGEYEKEYGGIPIPKGIEVAPVSSAKIIPLRASESISVDELANMRRFLSEDQIKEKVVFKLLASLVSTIDEMGLIDLQINSSSPEKIEYTISLDIVKHERN